MGRPASTSDRLTERQRQVIELVVRGRTNGEIAEELGISLDRAKWHVSELLTRFNVDSREQLVEAWESRRSNPFAKSIGWLASGGLWRSKVAIGMAGVAVGLAAIVVTVLVLGTLRGEDQGVLPDPTLAPSATPVRPTSTPGPFTGEVPSTVQVINTRTGAVTTIYEDLREQAWIYSAWPRGNAPFDGDLVALWIAQQVRYFRLDGQPASAPPGSSFDCHAYLRARGIEARYCGFYVYGDDGIDRFVYEVVSGEYTYPPDLVVSMTDLWVADVSSGELMLFQEGLVPCGGCDGRYGPEWSPSGRYLTFTETGGQMRRFLADVVTGATRQIGIGNDVGVQPSWSPTKDQLIYPPFGHERPVARFEDLETGESFDLDLPWPVEFDTTGTLVYTPSWGGGSKDTSGQTTIAEVGTGEVLAVLSGNVSHTLIWTGLRGIGSNPSGYVAVLQRSNQCDGTTIYRQAGSPICVPGGEEGYLNPDASRVAVARLTGVTGRITGPGLEAFEANVYAVDIADVATGSVATVVVDVIGLNPPTMIWHADGEHLLIAWPSSGVGL